MLNPKRLNLRKRTKLVQIFQKEQNCALFGLETKSLHSGKIQKRREYKIVVLLFKLARLWHLMMVLSILRRKDWGRLN